MFGINELSQTQLAQYMHNTKGFQPETEGDPKYFQEKFGYTIGGKNQEICTYENCEIRGSDLLRLCPSVFLNDTIINFYIRLLLKEFVFKEDVKGNYYIFNTYFFPKIRQIIDKTVVLNNEKNLGNSENYEIIHNALSETYPKLKKVNFLLKCFSGKNK